MAAVRLYPFWASLSEALRTGAPQNEAKSGGDAFAEIYSKPERLRSFLAAMTGASMGSARAIAGKFPWKAYKTFVDVGGAQGGVPVQLALAHKLLTGAAFDLPVVQPVYEEYVNSFGLEARLKFLPGDFFRDPMPQADVLILGHILHDWNLEKNTCCCRKPMRRCPGVAHSSSTMQ